MIKRFFQWLNEPPPEARELRCHQITWNHYESVFYKRYVVNGIVQNSDADDVGMSAVVLEKSDIEFLMESEA